MPIEITRLHKVVVLLVRCICATYDLSARGPPCIRIRQRVCLGTTIAVWRINGLVAVVTIAHCTIFIVAMHLGYGLVDWQLQVVNADTMAVRIRITEQASQQHLVWAGTNTVNHIRRLEGGLLDLSEEVLRIPIKDHP